MKNTILICIALLNSLAVSAKDFHFVYIRFDNSMIKNGLIGQIDELKSSFGSEDDFVVYYSNAQIRMDKNLWDAEELFSLITEQMSYPAISIPDEVDLISESLEKKMKLEFDGNDSNKRIVSGNGFSSLHFHYLVGKEFVASKNTDGLLARVFIINSLNLSDFSIKINYHPCGSYYAENALQFNPLYQISVNPKLVK